VSVCATSHAVTTAPGDTVEKMCFILPILQTDYVYVMDFDGEKIRHMTKIWHAGLVMKELGWI
jgi:hypothetical protein